MNQSNRQNRFIFMQRRPRSLLGQVGAFFVGITVLAVSFVFGAFILAAVFGFVLLLGLIAIVRAWWLKRQMISEPGVSQSNNETRSHDVIDGDFTVIETQRSNRKDD
jgi:hypothetical protein